MPGQAADFCLLLVCAAVYVTNLRWGGLKAKAGQRAPEDTFQSQSPTRDDVEAADRAGRVVSNDLENIPLGNKRHKHVTRAR